MKINNIAKASALVVGILMSASSWAAMIVDTLISQDTLADSGNATELAWVEGITGIELDQVVKYEADMPADPEWAQVGDSSVYYIDLENEISYFVVKFGHGGLNIDSHYLYENVADLYKAVIDLDEISTEKQFTISRYSHFVGYNGGETEVPEPATLLLMGLGLAGMAAARRKKA